jgi:hypothetical protein
MRIVLVIFSLMILPLPLALAGLSGGTIREGGIKIGTGRNTQPKGLNVGRGNSAVRIGEGRLSNSTRQRSFPTTTTTSPPAQAFTYAPQSSLEKTNITQLKVGARLFWGKRRAYREQLIAGGRRTSRVFFSAGAASECLIK